MLGISGRPESERASVQEAVLHLLEQHQHLHGRTLPHRAHHSLPRVYSRNSIRRPQKLVSCYVVFLRRSDEYYWHHLAILFAL